MRHEEIQYEWVSPLARDLIEGLDPYPKMVEIQPTYDCNQNCQYCFHKDKHNDYPRITKKLTIRQYSSLFSQMMDLDIKDLSISGGGEAFLDNRIVYLLRLAHQNELETRIVTNGTILPRKSVEEIMKSKEIRFSIDANDPKTYSNIRNATEKHYYRAIRNIEKLIKLKKQSNSKPEIGVTFLVKKENYIEVGDFCRRMLDMGVDAIIIKHDIYDNSGFLDKRIESVMENIREIDDERVEVRDKINMKVNGMRCFIPYFKVAFNPYGEFYSCCLGAQPEHNNGYSLGYLGNKKLTQIWEDSVTVRKRMRTQGVSCNICNYTDYRINKLLEMV